MRGPCAKSFEPYKKFKRKTISKIHAKLDKMGFSKFLRVGIFLFITQLVKKLQQRSLYGVIENILLFILNTEQPLRAESNSGILRGGQSSLYILRGGHEEIAKNVHKMI